MAVIRANRESIDDRFSVLGFTVRSELPLFEIAIATDPELLQPEHRARRTPRNFFTSRLQRAPQATRGEAVYLVPPDVVARFVGQQRLYFGMATYRENDRNTPVSLRMPDRGSLYVNLAGLSERGLRRTTRRSGGNGYGDAGNDLGWGGDAAGNAPAATREDPAPRTATPAKAADSAPYSDGYSDELWKQPAAAPAPATANAPAPAPAKASAAQALGYGYGRALADDGDDREIGGPIPDDLASAQAYATRGLALTAPEYPGARRYEPAATGNYRAVGGTRTIDKVVIHITDGGANINGTIGWFKNPAAGVSAHYVIGQDGEVVQMVAHNDVAWHARSANRTSIGIEHVANTRGLMPTVRQMEASAALVTWLCDTYGIPADRAHILGHAEADKKTTHTGCPNAVWNWDYYMQLISTRSSVTPPSSMPQSLGLARGYGRALADDGDDREIGGPIPDDLASAQAYATRGLALTAPEYPGARRYEPAATGNYRAVGGTRTIDKVVIHITDGGANINGTIGWFKNPAAGVSAHYVIGQDGEVVQMVAHNDVAWHARSANRTSIGIEHVANTRGLMPTVRQMEASAALVTWLCDTYGIPADRAHILGHAEADKKTTHTGCPNAVWNWDYYMQLISTRSCVTPPSSMPQSLGLGRGYGRMLAADGDEDDDPDSYGITSEEPEAFANAASLGFVARSLGGEAADYPGASRFAPAAKGNFHKGRRRGAVIDRIVIHITAGGPKIDGTIGWFQNPEAKVSAHYVVGRDGEVVQMVHDADTAYHASSANSRSIGIEHNANKPYKLNKRDLPPTEPQYAASAKLVAWLCATHGVPVDREHIVGHQEASPKDNHDCPSNYWHWDHYMDLVRAEARALAAGTPTPATAQSYSRGGYSTAQEIITPFYDPKDPSTALTCQNDAFSQAREEWFVGVDDTSAFPHSAICLLTMDDGSGGKSFGTGFYIGRNRILTCGHNLDGAAQVTIVPGKNGAGTKPFGSCTVSSSSWRVSPRYLSSKASGDDLAVIDNVPIAAPNGRWFEFLNGTPSNRLPLVVCGYSRKSDAVPELSALMDGDKQHLHGGYAASMSDPEVIEYPILTLHRASGSPVYTIEGSGSDLVAKVCAVHVSGAPAAKGLNRGCFLTPAKLDWIEGRAASFSLGLRANALEIPLDPGAGGRSIDVSALSPGDIIVSTARHPVSYVIRIGTVSSISHAMVYVGDGKVVEAVGDGVREVALTTALSGAILAVAYRDPRVDATKAQAIVDFARAQARAGKPYDYVGVGTTGYRILYPIDGRVLDKILELTGVTGNDAASFYCSELVFAAYAAAGIPLSTTKPDHSTPDDLVQLGGSRLQYVGHLVAHEAFLGIALGLSQSLAYGRALASDGPSDYDVQLIPQPDKNACWAASMAMLIGYRGQFSRTPESIINEIGGSLATSYGWELIKAAKKHYGFETIAEPSNASLYHTPRQWAEWLNTYGPLWVVIVGAPHAVVLAGIRGDLDDASKCKVKLLNPWDTRVSFDNDPVIFHPANNGYADWLSFNEFASDFGNMAEPNYGNWRILHLPASAAASQSLGYGGDVLRLKPAPASVRAQATGDEREEPIEPSRVAGARMRRIVGEAGGCRWSLDQLDGMKSPASPGFEASSSAQGIAKVALDDWPAIEGAPTPLPITVEFRYGNGSLGDVRIVHGLPANLAYGVEATAKIEDCADDGQTARLRIRVDYRFRGLAQGNPDATVELCLRGDGRHERDNQWRKAEPLSPAA